MAGLPTLACGQQMPCGTAQHVQRLQLEITWQLCFSKGIEVCLNKPDPESQREQRHFMWHVAMYRGQRHIAWTQEHCSQHTSHMPAAPQHCTQPPAPGVCGGSRRGAATQPEVGGAVPRARARARGGRTKLGESGEHGRACDHACTLILSDRQDGKGCCAAARSSAGARAQAAQRVLYSSSYAARMASTPGAWCAAFLRMDMHAFSAGHGACGRQHYLGHGP